MLTKYRHLYSKGVLQNPRSILKHTCTGRYRGIVGIYDIVDSKPSTLHLDWDIEYIRVLHFSLNHLAPHCFPSAGLPLPNTFARTHNVHAYTSTCMYVLRTGRVHAPAPCMHSDTPYGSYSSLASLIPLKEISLLLFTRLYYSSMHMDWSRPCHR